MSDWALSFNVASPLCKPAGRNPPTCRLRGDAQRLRVPHQVKDSCQLNKQQQLHRNPTLAPKSAFAPSVALRTAAFSRASSSLTASNRSCSRSAAAQESGDRTIASSGCEQDMPAGPVRTCVGVGKAQHRGAVPSRTACSPVRQMGHVRLPCASTSRMQGGQSAKARRACGGTGAGCSIRGATRSREQTARCRPASCSRAIYSYWAVHDHHSQFTQQTNCAMLTVVAARGDGAGGQVIKADGAGVEVSLLHIASRLRRESSVGRYSSW